VRTRFLACILAAGLAALGAGTALAGHDPRGGDDRWDWDFDHKHEKADKGGPFDFAFVGDGPYGVAAEPLWDNTIREINRDRDVRFVMHAGDVKAGSERCDDTLIERRFLQYQTLRVPFVYTPGDNEWTDCHRANNGSYNPLERLAFVRALFFANPHFSTGGHPMRVKPESDLAGYETFVENVMFERSGVLFATVHVVGSANSLAPWSGLGLTEVTPEQQAEYDARNAANLAWLDRVFDKAEARHARAVLVMMQANPNLEADPGSPDRLGFDDFLRKLHDRTAAFGGPVVLAHGDSHEFFVDKPFDTDAFEDAEGHRLPYFTRVECFGSQRNHWVKVHVDPSTPAVFTFEQRIVPENLP
jgi:hypothetical protein